jgi:predicted lipid-binding transport protein (Tim44 family)
MDNQQKPQVGGQNDAEKRNIMVLGIVSLGLIVLCPPAGIVVGYIGKKKADEYKKNNGAEPESAIMSTIGFIVNIVLTAIGAVAMICMIAFGGLVFNSASDTVNDALDTVKDELKEQSSNSKNKSDKTDDSQGSSSDNSSSASTAECDIAKQSLSSTQRSVASAESAYNAIQSNSAATDAVKNQYKLTLDSLKTQLTQAQARVDEVCQ